MVSLNVLTLDEINRSQTILDTILSIQPKEGGNTRGGETRESVVNRLAEDMLEKMPKDYIDHEASHIYPIDLRNPSGSFLFVFHFVYF